MTKNLLLVLALLFAVGSISVYLFSTRDTCRIPSVVAGVSQSGESPLFCNTKALTADERKHHTALTKQLFAAMQAKRELPDGLAFRLNPSAVTLSELADWVDAERKCCPFLDFRISLAREGGALELALTGRTGVKALLLPLFAQVTSAGP